MYSFNQDRMTVADFSVNSEPISFKFCKGKFSSQILTSVKNLQNIELFKI